MVHDTAARTVDVEPPVVHPLRAAVRAACAMVGISQNEFARRADVDQSICSRVLRRSIVSEPAEQKILAQLGRMLRQAKASQREQAAAIRRLIAEAKAA